MFNRNITGYVFRIPYKLPHAINLITSSWVLRTLISVLLKPLHFFSHDRVSILLQLHAATILYYNFQMREII